MARQKGRYWRKIRNIIFIIFLFGFFCWGAIRFYYPVESGTETGKLDFIVYKGQVFKTYEGKLIRSEAKTVKDGEIPSHEFVFSIAEKHIAEQLMLAGDRTVEVRYSKYFGSIPWRGDSRYIVDEIINISEEKEKIEVELIAIYVAYLRHARGGAIPFYQYLVSKETWTSTCNIF